MSHITEITLKVTDEHTNKVTLESSTIERNVSFAKVLELEEALLELSKARLEGTKDKYKV